MSIRSKIVSFAKLKKELARLKKARKTIAFTNGCFDILHYGHVSYLERAKKDNRVLVVGLNSDESVRRLKGPERPVNPQLARAVVLAALESVDYVTVFTEDTPEKLIKAVLPDVLIKGADWKGKPVVGSDAVKANGGKVEFIKFEDNFSTTKIIEDVRASCAKP
ncbi:MAG: D-glycero-beta-D-manno-heptose 1-phosphate adenylyltransferase [Candidatus Omnitrophica bacterium]|nr:D-glycero-beta-D-manno-heptose 1-phosphate adenylyltransferase [Candidatus Omnitrophota bacterium]